MGTDRSGRAVAAPAGDAPQAARALRLAPTSEEHSNPPGGRQVAGIGLFATVLVIFTALASRPFVAAPGAIHHAPAGTWSVVYTVLLLVGIVDLVLLAIVTYAIVSKRHGKGRDEEEQRVSPPIVVYWSWRLLAMTLLFLLAAGLVVLAVTLTHGSIVHPSHGAPPSLGTLGPRRQPRPLGRPNTGVASPGVNWIELLVAALLVLLAVIGVIWSARSGRLSRAAKPTLGQDLAAALDESLWDVCGEAEPRRAVIAAYATMERILAAHGSPRYDFEAPLEYLARLFRGLQANTEALMTLTNLYEIAKFSHHDINEAMRERAISALTTIRRALRDAA